MLAALVFLATLNALPPCASAQALQSPAGQPGQSRQSRSEHYDLTIEACSADLAPNSSGCSALDPQDLTRMLELAWPRFTASCGNEPTLVRDARFRVRIARSKDTWLSALHSEGAAPPPNVDRLYYRPETETLHLVRQDSAWSTRALLLRGAWTQFYARARPKNLELRTRWWVTTLGEHFAMHTWDGRDLSLGVHTLIAPVDVPANALLALDPAQNVGMRFSDDLFRDHDVAWAISELVLSRDSPEDRARFDKLVQGKVGGKQVFEEFSRTMGRPGDLWKELQAKLEAGQMPFVATSGTWEDTGHAIAVWPAQGAAAICVLREPARELAFDLELDAGAAGGMVVAWVDAQNHTLARLTRADDGVPARGRVSARIDQIAGGKTSTIAEFAVGADAKLRMRGARKLDAVQLWIGNEQRGPYEVPGDRLGLWASSPGVRFAALTWH